MLPPDRYLFLINLGLCLFTFPFVVLPAAALFHYQRDITYTMQWTDVLDGKGPVGETWMFFGVSVHAT